MNCIQPWFFQVKGYLKYDVKIINDKNLHKFALFTSKDVYFVKLTKLEFRSTVPSSIMSVSLKGDPVTSKTSYLYFESPERSSAQPPHVIDIELYKYVGL